MSKTKLHIICESFVTNHLNVSKHMGMIKIKIRIAVTSGQGGREMAGEGPQGASAITVMIYFI